MSQINDALKRASQADRQREKAASPTPLPAAAPVDAPTSSPSAGRVLAGAVVLVLLSAACFVLLRAFRPNRQAPSAPPVAVSSESPPAPAPIPPAAKPAPATTSPAPTPPPPPAPPPLSAAQPLPPPPPPFPALRLQAIFYSKINPRALINGQTAAVGDVIAEARVENISPDTVTVDWRAQKKTLSLGAP